MFRLIILIAIFFAVYPMIGNGYSQFMSDFNINGVGEIVSNMITGIGSLSNYFDMIIRRGNEMEVSLKEFEQTREEILAEEVN